MKEVLTSDESALQDADNRNYHVLGLAQLPIWLDLLVAGDANFRIGGWARLDGRLNHDDLRKSIKSVMARHDGLRVRVDPDKPRQWVDESSEPPLNIIEYDGADPEEALQIQIERFASESMPLGDHPLFRIDLVEAGPYSYLTWRLHHIIADHFSVRIALAHLFNAYQVVTSDYETKLNPGSSILDILNADAEYLQSSTYKRDLAYWVDRFDPMPPALLGIQPSRIGLQALPPSTHRVMDSDRFAAFTAAAKDAGTLPQRALFALFAVALARRYGQTDITCGMLLHRRDRSNFHVVGMLTGFIPVRSQFESWWTLTECVQAVSEQVDADLRHQRLPNDILHRELGSPKHGLFDAMMSWMPGDDAEASDSFLPGMIISGIDTRDPSAITLKAQQVATTGGLNFKVAINPDFADMIDGELLTDLLDEVVTTFIEEGECEFESISAMSQSETQRLTVISQAAEPLVNASDAATLADLVADFAQTQPDAPAVIEAIADAQTTVPTWRSYAEFDADASRLAHVLTDAGVKPDSVVGVCLERDTELLTTLFAIWKAGATYLPLDGNYPDDRLAFMLEDASAQNVVASGDAASKLATLGAKVLRLDTPEYQCALEAASTEPVIVAATAQSLAYLIYTSGSTGKPKGVMVAHSQLMAFRNGITAVVGVNSDDCILSAAAPIFDAFFMDLVVSLGMGARMVRMQARALAGPGYLSTTAEMFGASYMDLTPSVWRAALSSGWQPGPNMRVVSGGEAIDAGLASRLTANGAKLFNSYGPTEATVVAIAGEIHDPEVGSAIAIGKPLAGTEAYVLDDNQALLPIGMSGELVLGGKQITNGYLNRADLTACAFIKDTFSDHPDARLYRTGDLVRWRTDGQLEFLGRIDTQVKIRGMRVELGEIEAALSALGEIAQAIVTAPVDADGQAQLRAYIVPKSAVQQDNETSAITEVSEKPQVLELDGLIDLGSIRTALQLVLPEHMIPHAFVGMSSIALTPSGKVDLRALPDVDAQVAQAEYVDPQGPTEQLIAEAIAELLNVPQVGRHDSFFALGGHSLLAVRLAARLEAELGNAVPVRTIFENPDIVRLGLALGNLAEVGDTASGPALVAVDRARSIPLSYSQERLWFVERFSDQMGANAEIMGYDLSGEVDSVRMRRVIAALFSRHEALRLRVEVVERSPVQVFADPATVPFEELDLTAQSVDEQQQTLASLQAAPIDPRQGVFYAKLIRLSSDGEKAPVLLLGIHHMANDGVSLAIIMEEFVSLWNTDGDGSNLPILPVQYADFALWQRDALDNGHLAKGLERYETILRNPPAELELPRDRARPEQPSHKGETMPVVLSVELTKKLRDLARQQGATLFMVLESALAVLLSRYARTDDLIIGTVAAGRSNVALERTIGPFFNMTALRHKIAPDATFENVLQDTRAQALSAFDDQLVPYEVVLRRVVKERSARLAFAPLFQVLFQLHNEFGGMPDPFVFGEVTARKRAGRVTPALHDLTFDMFEVDDQVNGIEGRLSYATDLFDSERMERLVVHYRQLLTAIAAQPDVSVTSLSMITDDERHRVLHQFNARVASGSTYSDAATMADLVAGFAHSNPDAPALIEALAGDVQTTAPVWRSYGDLDVDASRLAHVLKESGVKAGDVVGVCLERDSDLLTTLFALWKAGATYLPLDDKYPQERLAFMLEDAGATRAVASGVASAKISALGATVLDLGCTELQNQLDAASAEHFDSVATAKSLAYLIYTSGSTGKPKGVMVAHAQLMAFRNAITADVGVSADDCVFSAAAPIFDAFFMDLVVSLGMGARMVRLQARELAGPGYLAAAVESYGATYMDLTPSVWRAALSSGWRPHANMRVVSGGEALDAELASLLIVNSARLYNSYGPTEATVVAIGGEIVAPQTGAAIAIGKPLAGTQAYVLDNHLEPLPVGVPGELVLGGSQITEGYLNRPDLTATAFINDPFSDAADARVYRTGDLVRWCKDGQLEFLGRIDTQVKIRGMRVELGEIEAALSALEGISQAVVTAPVDADGQASLCAYLVPSELPRNATTDTLEILELDGLLDLGKLRASLLHALPEHMVPHAYVGVSMIPLSASGKADRRALPDVDARIAQAEYVAPQSEQEQRIADAVAELLEIEQVGRHDSFFALGGHSLLAVRLAARLEADIGVTVPIRTLFENPDIISFGAALDALVEAGDTVAGIPLVAADRSQNIPLSFSQERLWFVERFGDQMGANAEVLAYELTGEVDSERMQRVIAVLFARHEALRLRVELSDRSPVQVFSTPDVVPYEELDLRAHSSEMQQQIIAQLCGAPIDPRNGVFWAKLVRLSSDGSVAPLLLLGIHHMANDGVSLAIIMSEFAALWSVDADASILPGIAVQYADFALWQREALEHGHLAKGLERFETVLRNPPAELELPSDRPRPEQPSHKGGTLDVTLPVELTEQLRRLANEQGATLFMVLESALAVLLSRYARTDDLIIGTVAAGRSNVALEGAVGPFFNMVALRHRIDPEASFLNVLDDTRAQALSAFDDQLVPYEAVLRSVVKERSARLAFAPLFQVLFQLHNEFGRMPDPFTFGDVTAYARDRHDSPALHDLTFDLFEGDGERSGIEGQLSYATDLFDAERMERLLGHYQQLLTAIVAQPDLAVSSLPIITAGERNRVLSKFNEIDTARLNSSDAATMADLVAGYAQSQPDALAVVEALASDAATTVPTWRSYAQLDADASRLAHVLMAQGVVAGDVVGVCLDRDSDLLTTLFALWKAGATYLPLDDKYPQERLAFMLEDAGATRAVASGVASAKISALGATVLDLGCTELQNQLDAASAEHFDSVATAKSLAYLIYTSGSTGKPKGVMVAHAQLMAFRNAITADVGVSADDCVFSAAAPIFDAFFMDLVVSLGMGARMVRLQARELAGPEYLPNAVEKYGATYMDLTPSVWRAALTSGWQPPATMRVVSGGEALDAELVSQLSANGARIYNSYGPTEATVVAIAGEVFVPETGQAISIGKPLFGTQAYVLDAHLEPLPIGIPGELVLGGSQITEGYLNRPDLTATAFINDPFSDKEDARVYRTGDLVRWCEDGQLEFLGRIDTQVKIRGMRVELGEIEAALSSLESVGQAVVTAPVDADGQAKLLAYLVPQEVPQQDAEATDDVQVLELDGLLDLGKLRTDLLSVLPQHMIPHAFVGLSTIPLTASGKADRRALPDVDARIAQAEYVAPQSEQEQRIADAVAELLEIEQVGRHDSFFALGGHSLLAVRLAARLEADIGVTVPIRTLFENPDIISFGAALDALVEAGDTVAGIPLVAADRSQNIPLSFSQEQFWVAERIGDQIGANAVVIAYDLNGKVDSGRMQRVIATLFARHEALRMRVSIVERSPVQIFADCEELPFEELDLTTQSEEEQQQTLARIHAAPIDPRKGVFWAKLVRLSDEENNDSATLSMLMIGIHHMAHDGVSLAIIMSEFAALWAADGDGSILPTLPVQYADFALWQREALDNGHLAKGLDRFETILRNPPAELELPSDRARPEQPSHNSGSVSVELPVELTEQLRRLATEQGATLFMVLESAMAVLLSRYAHTEDLVIGTVVAGRSNSALEGTVGPFMNMTALRHHIEPDTTFLNVLQNTRAQALSAFDDQLVPYEAVLRRVVKQRSARLAFAPLFQVLFQLHNEFGRMPDPITFGDVTAHARGRHDVALLQDLNFDLFEGDGENNGIEGQLSYATDLFNEDRMERLVSHYLQLLNAIVVQPDISVMSLSMITADERERVLHQFNAIDTQMSIADSPTMAHMAAEFALSQPYSPALIEATVDTLQDVALKHYGYSYGELDAFSSRLAHVLIDSGVEPGSVVGVSLNWDTELLITLFAVWKAGAIYLPLDSNYPAERLSFMLDDTKASLIVSAGEKAAKLSELGVQVLRLDSEGLQDQLERAPNRRLDVAAKADSLAYVIYTSGSTGKPKGVMVEHAQLMALRNAVTANESVTSDDCIFSASAPIFDAFFSDLVAAFGTGARMVRLQARSLAEEGYLTKATDSYDPTYMDLTPSVWRAALSSGWQPGSHMRLFSGGEVLDAELASRLIVNGARLFNCYGPTEATVTATVGEVTTLKAGETISIGRPLPGVRAYVVDSHLQPLPIGVPGELVLGGAQITGGYLNRPELTATAFIADPFSNEPNARAYRTGDLVCWRSDGQLDFLGRIDSQVKIRGMRIELGEIEAALSSLDEISQAVVTAISDAQGRTHLRAYFVPASLVQSKENANTSEEPEVLTLDGLVDLATLRIALQRMLPDHMIPHEFVGLSTIPLSASGKADRRALPDVEAQIAQAEYVTPESEQEQRVADAISELLEIEKVGRHDNFFALGGHSLLAVRLAARLEADLDIAIPIRTIFEYPEVVGFAAALDALVERGNRVVGPPLVPIDRDQPIPLSYSQERLWFVERFGDQMGANAVVMAYNLTGVVNVERMKRVVATLFARHEALRLQVKMVKRVPVQIFANPDSLPFEELDLTMQSLDEQQQSLARLNEAPIDPRKGAFWAKLVRYTNKEACDTDGSALMLMLGIHHMAYDGVSLAIIMGEFASLWTADGDASKLPELPVQYADFAHWQREALDNGHLAEGLDRFETILRNPPAELELPRDRVRPEQPSHEGGTVNFTLPVELTERLHSLAREQGASLYMVLESALAVLLSRYARTDDLIIGTVVAGRSNVDLEGVVGPFINMAALRHRIEPDMTFLSVLKDTRSQALSAFDDQLVPYEAVLRRVVKERSARLAFAPLFQVLFQLHNEYGRMPDPIRFGDVTAHACGGHDNPALHDLTFDLYEVSGESHGIEGQISYATDLFDAVRIERMVDHYCQLLTSIAAQPDIAVTCLSMITDDEKLRVVKVFNAPDAKFSIGLDAPTMVDLVARFAQSHPDSPAVVEALAGDVETTEAEWRSYRELDADASRLAHVFMAQGVVAGDVVGVCLDRDSDLLSTLFAIWKLGATYLPLDGTYPDERLSFMLEDASATRVVASGDAAKKIGALGATVLRLDSAEVQEQLASASEEKIDVAATADSLAYLIYTSGSTGKPKGVMVAHAQLMAFRNAITADVGVSADDCVFSAAAPIFDAFFMDLVVSLGMGARMVRLQARELAGPEYLPNAVEKYGATYMDLTPSVWRAALTSGWQPPATMRVVSGGEALDAELVSQLSANGARIYNSYGPTEATVVAIAGEVFVPETGQAISIGKPLFGTQAYVLDAHLEPLPIGIPGELVLGGSQITEGYLNRPDLTATAFINDPFSDKEDARVYRTGDLVRWCEDGQLEFLGRIDTQVKIRGMRVELGEIEAALSSLESVGQAVVTAPVDADGQAKLLAYLVPQEVPQQDAEATDDVQVLELDGLLDLGKLRTDLLSVLPQHMIPHAFVGLSTIPLTASGKADRRALPDVDARIAQAEYVAPQSEQEQRIADAVAELLEIEQVGRHDSFFALGGHSLLAVRLAARLEAETGIAVPIRILFENNDVEGYAVALDRLIEEGNVADGPPMLPIDRTQPIRMSYAQESLCHIKRYASDASSDQRITGALTLMGDLNLEALNDALLTVVNRHDVLRTNVLMSNTSAGVAQLLIACDADAAGFLLETENAQGEDGEAIAERVIAFTERSYDLKSRPLFCAKLIQVSINQHILALGGHLAVIDRWTLGLLLHEVAELYAAICENRIPELLPVELQHADYAAWERAMFTAEHPHVQWWIDALAGASPALELRTDRPRPETMDYRHEQVSVAILPSVTQALTSLAREEGTSLFVALQSALAIFLTTRGADRDVVLATNVSGRPLDVLRGMVGPFENTLLLRQSIDYQKTYSEQLRATSDRTLAAFEHQSVPFGAIVDAMDLKLSSSYAPLAQVRLVLHEDIDITRQLRLPGIELSAFGDTPLAQIHSSRFDISLEFNPSDSGLEGTLSFASQLFNLASAQQMAIDFANFVAILAHSPNTSLSELILSGDKVSMSE